ncbi:MAG: hypothetical protein LBH05_04365 [Deferribacteraceae bacterium]|nr:hypothetical protein [Deferribacteraceae bacterium]
MGTEFSQKFFIGRRKWYVFYNAADLPLDPVSTSEIIKLISDKTDLLILQRKKYIGTNIWRRFTSFINRSMVLMLFPKEKWGIRDTNYTQVFRKDIIKQILPMARSLEYYNFC